MSDWLNMTSSTQNILNRFEHAMPSKIGEISNYSDVNKIKQSYLDRAKNVIRDFNDSRLYQYYTPEAKDQIFNQKINELESSLVHDLDRYFQQNVLIDDSSKAELTQKEQRILQVVMQTAGLEALRKQLAEAKNNYDKLLRTKKSFEEQAKIDAMNAAKAEYEKLQRAKVLELSKIKSEKKMLERQLQSSEQKQIALANEIKNLQTQIDKNKEELKTLFDKLPEKYKRFFTFSITKTTIELPDIDKFIDALVQEIAKNEALINEYKSKLPIIISNINKINKNIDSTRADITFDAEKAYEEQFKTYNDTLDLIDKYVTDTKQLRDDLAKAQQLLTDVKQANALLKNDFERIQQELASLRDSSKTEKSQEIDKLKAEYHKALLDIQKQHESIKQNILQSKSTAPADIETLKQQIQSRSTEIDTLKNGILRDKEQIQTLIKNNAEQQSKILLLQQENSNMQFKIETQTRQIDSQNQKLSMIEQQNKSLSEQLQRQSEEFTRLNKEKLSNELKCNEQLIVLRNTLNQMYTKLKIASNAFSEAGSKSIETPLPMSVQMLNPSQREEYEIYYSQVFPTLERILGRPIKNLSDLEASAKLLKQRIDQYTKLIDIMKTNVNPVISQFIESPAISEQNISNDELMKLDQATQKFKTEFDAVSQTTFGKMTIDQIKNKIASSTGAHEDTVFNILDNMDK